MIERILPAGVACAEAFTDVAGAELFPQEASLVANAVWQRRREFATARDCARRALGQLGIPPVPILAGDRREPQWPPGIVGSITHCRGYRAAGVAFASQLLTIGLDAEPDDPLPDGVLGHTSLASERRAVAALGAAAPGISWDRLLFSAKEAVYKAWFPLTRRWLGFEEAEITIDADGGRFHAHLLVPGPMAGAHPLTGFDGRWLAARGLILTAIAVPQPGY